MPLRDRGEREQGLVARRVALQRREPLRAEALPERPGEERGRRGYRLSVGALRELR